MGPVLGMDGAGWSHHTPGVLQEVRQHISSVAGALAVAAVVVPVSSAHPSGWWWTVHKANQTSFWWSATHHLDTTCKGIGSSIVEERASRHLDSPPDRQVQQSRFLAMGPAAEYGRVIGEAEPEPPAAEGAIEMAQMKRCPDCAELLKQEARICRFCRFDPTTTVDDIEQLAALRGRGVLTDAEYQAAMARLFLS